MTVSSISQQRSAIVTDGHLGQASWEPPYFRYPNQHFHSG